MTANLKLPSASEFEAQTLGVKTLIALPDYCFSASTFVAISRRLMLQLLLVMLLLVMLLLLMLLLVMLQ